MTMQITINDEMKMIEGERASIEEILAAEGIDATRSAVALNSRLVSRPDYSTTYATDGDSLLVINAAFGG